MSPKDRAELGQFCRPNLLHRTQPYLLGRTVDNGGHDNLINVGSIEDGSEFVFLPVIFVLYEFIAGAETKFLANIRTGADSFGCIYEAVVLFKSSLRDDVDLSDSV